MEDFGKRHPLSVGVKGGDGEYMDELKKQIEEQREEEEKKKKLAQAKTPKGKKKK